MVKKHDVVQVIPEHEWAGAFVYVTEVKEWGIQGFVNIPLQGSAYIRLKNGEYDKIGEAIYRPFDEEE